MFSHIFVGARDFDRALALYRALMPMLGIQERFCAPERVWVRWQSHTDPHPQSSSVSHTPVARRRLATARWSPFLAASREVVDQAFAVVLTSSGSSEGAPGLRPEYTPLLRRVLPGYRRQQALCRLPLCASRNLAVGSASGRARIASRLVPKRPFKACNRHFLSHHRRT